VTSTPPPREPARGPRITPTRVTTWIVVGGIGIFLLVSGILGMIAKG
jgi:hypothetical protein